MKKIISIIALFYSITLFGYNLEVSGIVKDMETGTPIEGITILITIDTINQGFQGYQNIVYSDSSGFFEDIITIPDSTYGTIEITADSCSTTITHNYQFSDNSFIITDIFYICSNNSNQCEASFTYDNINETGEIQFYNTSTGNYLTAHWNFGDSTTSDELNPLHTFPSEGTYLTSLTISGDSCYNSFSMNVVVYFDTIENCQAAFWYAQETGSKKIMFYDLSTGNIDEWMWDFGDGDTSFISNPEHLYNESGSYNVKLSIVTTDSCTSQYEESIYVYEDSTNCNADFVYELDTLNNTPYTYYFYNLSSGQPEYFLWEFGDGFTSSEQNPVHIYESPGSYYVCLTVQGSQSDTNCYSTFCDSIVTPQYYNFGGQAFIGEYPINIDSSDNYNTATAFLYRKIKNSWEYMDNITFWKYGYYWFTEKPEGEYLIYAELLNSSEEYSNYAPVYHSGSLSWKNASTFILQDNEQFSVNLSFMKLSQKETGTGIITGYVYGDSSCDTLSSINQNHILIQLFNTDNNIIDFTYTDDNGYYELENLANGSYTIKAEYPGRYTESQEITLSNTSNSVVMDLIVYCSHILTIDNNNDNNDVINIYPNPANSSFNISFNTAGFTSCNICILDATGKEIIENSYYLIKNNLPENININNLSTGYYTVKISDNITNNTIIRKLIVIK